jgi:hypothetical protein
MIFFLVFSFRVVCLSLVLSFSLSFFLVYTFLTWGPRYTVVKVLRYKSEGRWFEPTWCHGVFR